MERPPSMKQCVQKVHCRTLLEGNEKRHNSKCWHNPIQKVVPLLDPTGLELAMWKKKKKQTNQKVIKLKGSHLCSGLNALHLRKHSMQKTMREIAFLTSDKLTDCNMSGRSIILFNNISCISPSCSLYQTLSFLSTESCLNFL